jgi:membrane-associated phospholipid phosphatase
MNITVIKQLALHKVLVAYCLFTVLLSFLPSAKLINGWSFYLPKIIVFLIVGFWPLLNKYFSTTSLNLINVLLGIGFLGFFYNETGQLNQLFFEPMDPWLIKMEGQLFGFQPSQWFSTRFPGIIMVELMNLGYLSYYFFIIGFVLLALYQKPENYNHLLFLICQSFIIYYLIFIFIPSWGPQFYFSAPYNHIPEGAFFQKTIAFIQSTGEAKTGAMPSSHVGMTVIVMILMYQYFRKYFWFLVPFALLLICSTVYIKAHYLIDVIGGLISAPLILFVSQQIWNLLNKPKNN